MIPDHESMVGNKKTLAYPRTVWEFTKLLVISHHENPQKALESRLSDGVRRQREGSNLKFMIQETIRIALLSHSKTGSWEFSRIQKKKIEALERVKEIALPTWYKKTLGKIKMIDRRVIRIDQYWSSGKREVITILFLWKPIAQIDFYYA